MKEVKFGEIKTVLFAARDYLTKWSKSERERQIYDITYMWNLKYDTNEPVYETESTTWRTDLWWGEGWQRDGIRGWG